MQQERSSSAAIALIWFHSPYIATARRPGVEMTSVMLLPPVSISAERSTDQPCARNMCNTAWSFTHESNTCVIRRLVFLNLGFIHLLSCTCSLTTLHNLSSQDAGLSTNLKILRLFWEKMGISKMIVLLFGVWVIGVVPRRVRKIN